MVSSPKSKKARLVKEDKRDKTWSVVGGGFLILIGLLGLVIAIAAGIADPDWGFPNWVWTRLWLYLAARLGRDWLLHSEPRLCQIPGSTQTGGRTRQHHQGGADIDAH